MGLGFGIECERCGKQLSYEMYGYTLKEEGGEFDLCDTCAKIIAFDKKLKENN